MKSGRADTTRASSTGPPCGTTARPAPGEEETTMQPIGDTLHTAAGLPPETAITPAEIDRSSGHLHPVQPASDEVRCHICDDAGFLPRHVPPGPPAVGKA